MRESRITRSKQTAKAIKYSQSVSRNNQKKSNPSNKSQKNHKIQAKKAKIVKKRVTKRPVQSKRITRQSKQSQVDKKLSHKPLQQVYIEKSHSKRQKPASRNQNNGQSLQGTSRINNQLVANQQPHSTAVRIPRISAPVTTRIAWEEQSSSSQSSVVMNLRSDSSSSSSEQLQNVIINRPNRPDIIGRAPQNISTWIRYFEENVRRNLVYRSSRHFGLFSPYNFQPKLRWNENNFDWFFAKNRIIKTEEITEEILQKSIQCPICLQDFIQNANQTEKMQNKDLMQLFCKHIFHKTCAQKSLKQHKAKCPMCRKDFRDHQVYEQFDANYKNRFNQQL